MSFSVSVRKSLSFGRLRQVPQIPASACAKLRPATRPPCLLNELGQIDLGRYHAHFVAHRSLRVAEFGFQFLSSFACTRNLPERLNGIHEMA